MYGTNLTDSPDPFVNPLDAVLADIAINIQLPPSLHAKADDRYEAVRNFAERDGSRLKGRVLRFTPQGSMAIDATISSRGTDDEFDLDIVAELDMSPTAAPDAVLDELFRAVEGYPTSRKVERQTRCVTIRYADGMHLDITPAVRLPGGNERESHIFHANPEKPTSQHYHVPMNAWGFAQWYLGRTPTEAHFAEAFNQRYLDAYGYQTLAEAEVDELPDQVPLIIKNTATVALQLLKRFRNVQYANATGRIPPSVMLSCFAGHAASPHTTLSDMVIRQARMIADAIRKATLLREKISVLNPVYQRDCFTDRWPENLDQQRAFADMLTMLADTLCSFKRRDVSLEDLQAWLRVQFGALVVSRSVAQFSERLGKAVQSAQQVYTSRGGVYVPAAPALVGLGGSTASSNTVGQARRHTFMGGTRR